MQTTRTGVILLALLTVSCGMMSSGPSQAVKSFYTACNAGDYTKAETYLAAEMKGAVSSGVGAMFGGTKTLCEISTKNGTLSSVEIKNENVKGDSGDVDFVLHYKDNTTQEQKETVVKEKDGWKLGH